LYTGTPACYEISTALRDGKPITGGVKAGGNQEIYDRIQEAFKAAPAINHTVYRGMNLPGDKAAALLQQARKAMESNGTIELAGLSSTSLDPRQATDFADKGHKEGNGKIMMEIRATRGLYLSGLSRFKSEQEILLNHGAKFRVVGIKDVPYSEIQQGRNAFDAKPVTRHRQTLILEQIEDAAAKAFRVWMKIYVGPAKKGKAESDSRTDRFVSDGNGISFAMGTPDLKSRLRARLSSAKRPQEWLALFARAFEQDEKTAFAVADRLYAQKFGEKEGKAGKAPKSV
jgi:hypothetical protein